MLFHTSNLPYIILLGIGISLFLLVIFSGGLDNDADLDAEAELDVDADADVDFSAGDVLGWLGIGKAPLLLLLAIDFSLWGVAGWMLNVLLGIPKGILSGFVLVGSMVVSLFLGSLISQPLGKIFASFGEDTSSDRLIGCLGTVSSSSIPTEDGGKIGQVDVIDPASNLVTISAILPQWATVIPHRGQEVIVIDRQPHSYLVIANDRAEREKWLAR